jgi:hypothetical protein
VRREPMWSFFRQISPHRASDYIVTIHINQCIARCDLRPLGGRTPRDDLQTTRWGYAGCEILFDIRSHVGDLT